jgi:ABC-type nitrate/sulfonate/bicarbonate transport system substrate-binding protein
MPEIEGKIRLSLMAAASAVALLAWSSASAEDIKLSASAIGRPPIFSNTFVDVGEVMGYWKKVGLDMNFRWFQRGTDTAKAVVTGDVQVGYTATPPAVNLIASGAPIVAIAGMPNQDWVIASDALEVKGCQDLKGKTVAADGINNTRYLYLQAVAATCGLKVTDMTLIDLANAPLVKAGIAGQVHSAVFHIDELAQVEHKTGKRWKLIDAPESIRSGLHYAVLITSKKAITENREGVIRFLEGWILAQRFMGSTKREDRAQFAKIAADASQIDVEVARSAIDAFQKIPYWVNNDGLDEKQVVSQIDQLINAGSMKPENRPSYGTIVEKSLYAEAAKRAEKPR